MFKGKGKLYWLKLYTLNLKALFSCTISTLKLWSWWKSIFSSCNLHTYQSLYKMLQHFFILVMSADRLGPSLSRAFVQPSLLIFIHCSNWPEAKVCILSMSLVEFWELDVRLTNNIVPSVISISILTSPLIWHFMSKMTNFFFLNTLCWKYISTSCGTKI